MPKKKYHQKENKQYTNSEAYKNYSNNFMNTNSNYIRNPSTEIPNTKKEYYYSNYQYVKGRGYSNKDKYNWNNFNNFYEGGKKEENDIVTKPMFTNSKLENNGNPEGNFVKIDIVPEEKKNFNLTNIGEIPINENTDNSLLAIKSLLFGKGNEKKENNINESSTEDKKNEIPLLIQTNNNLKSDSNSLPWRSGSTFSERGGEGYKKDYYNKSYTNNKKDYYYSNGKNYNRNRYKYNLNQPQTKK